MLNLVLMMGRITKEPIQNKSGETIIVNFDIAVDNLRKEADGTRGTTFLPVVCFNTIGENVVKHLHKGSKIAVKGSLQQRNFIRKDGSKGTAYEVIAESVEFLDGKPLDNAQEMEGEEAIVETPDVEPVQEAESPKYDPYTGKPLKPNTKK